MNSVYSGIYVAIGRYILRIVLFSWGLCVTIVVGFSHKTQTNINCLYLIYLYRRRSLS